MLAKSRPEETLVGESPFGTATDYILGLPSTITAYRVVVEVHEAEVFRDLYYHVGVVDTARKVIEWGDCYHYDSGLAPAVASPNKFFGVIHYVLPCRHC